MKILRMFLVISASLFLGMIAAGAAAYLLLQLGVYTDDAGVAAVIVGMAAFAFGVARLKRA